MPLSTRISDLFSVRVFAQMLRGVAMEPVTGETCPPPDSGTGDAPADADAGP